MADLYNIVAEANIGGRVFSYPPFSIEFEQTLKIGVPSSTVLKLYNPAPDTVKACEKMGNTFPNATISAGYEDENGTCVIGSLYDFMVKKSGVDNVLECKISDATSKWQNSIINKSYKSMTGTAILQAVLSQVGITYDTIQLETDKTYSVFTATTLRNTLTKIVKDTGSEYYFKNGTLVIQKKTARNVKNVYNLTPETGLVETPQKTQRGYKFNTLFFYQLNVGDYVKLQTSTINTQLKIINGKKKFSTFNQSGCEWEGVE